MKIKWISLLFIVIIFVLSGCKSNQQTENTDSKEPVGEKFVYTKYDLPVKGKAIMGEKEAPHTIYLAFDYACPWCKKWMLEVLPVIKEEFIDSGEVKYISQAVSLLSEHSFRLATADYIMEKKLPNQYFDYQLSIASDAPQDHTKMDNDWGTDHYIKAKIKGLGENYNELFDEKENIPDNLTLTRQFTKQYGMEYVPTVYVDGIKISNSFDINEMRKIIKKEIKEGDVTYLKNE